jgi:hypothetical protein
MINIQLDREITFDLPIGHFKGEIIKARKYQKQTRKGPQDWVRITFEVEVPGKERFECRAGRNFQLSFKPGSDLRNFLTPILGVEFFRENSAGTIELEGLLEGKEGQVMLNHYQGDGFEEPLVVVESFVPNHEGKD